VVIVFIIIIILLYCYNFFLNGRIPRGNLFDRMRVVWLIFKYSVRARRRRELIRIQISLSVPGGNRYFTFYVLTRWCYICIGFFPAAVKKKNKKLIYIHVPIYVCVYTIYTYYIGNTHNMFVCVCVCVCVLARV